jgi:hypothetical protein
MFGVPRRVWQMLLIGKSCRDLVWAIDEMEVKAGSVVVFVAVGNHGPTVGIDWDGTRCFEAKSTRTHARTYTNNSVLLRWLQVLAGFENPSSVMTRNLKIPVNA